MQLTLLHDQLCRAMGISLEILRDGGVHSRVGLPAVLQFQLEPAVVLQRDGAAVHEPVRQRLVVLQPRHLHVLRLTQETFEDCVLTS